MSGPRVALAVNPASGRGRGAQAGEAAAAVFRAARIDVTVLIGSDADDLRRRISDALAEGYDALVVTGGDGMVNLGVNAVAGTGVPLGIIAAGTGNDLARTLGLPVRDAPAAADVVVAALRDGTRRSIDAVRCTWGAGEQRWFAGVLAAGFDAVVNERANGWKWPAGRPKYVLAMLRELPVLRPRRYVVELDGERREVEALLVAVGNAPSYGGGMRVTPDADLTDGLVDVMVAERVGTPEFLRIFPRVYAGTHVTHPAVTVHRARTVSIDLVTPHGPGGPGSGSVKGAGTANGSTSPNGTTAHDGTTSGGKDGIVGYADGERFGPLPMTCVTVPGAVTVLAAERPEPPVTA